MVIRKHSSKRFRDQRADANRGTARERGYSTEWDKFAKSHLLDNPLCRYCAEQGRASGADLVDHIIPHKGDPDRFWPEHGANWDDFFAACCKPCHDGPKQRAEALSLKLSKDVRAILREWGMLPEGFPGSDPHAAVPNAGASLIVGPPASGKTTLADKLAVKFGHQRDIYDLDTIAEGLGLPRYGRTLEQAKRAIMERDILLSSHKPRYGLILIASCPTVRERRYWAERLNCEPTILIEPRDVLVRRIRDRSGGDRRIFEAQIAALDLWLARTDI